MMSLTSMLCCLWRGALCGVARKEPQEETAKEAPGENKANDLTVIRGIGIVTQNQLYKAGIKTYAALASARPEELRGHCHVNRIRSEIEVTRRLSKCAFSMA